MFGKTTAMRVAIPAALCALALATTSAASAEPADATKQWVTVAKAQLGPVNGTAATGESVIVLRGTQADVWVKAIGLVPALPHPQHIRVNGRGVCPEESADVNQDGVVSTTEGVNSYGDIGVSLTASGDTDKSSAFTSGRFPAAQYGIHTYHRTITLTDEVAAKIRAGNAVLVLQGVDINRNGAYDGGVQSDVNPALSLEETSPTACGSYWARSGWDIDADLNVNSDLDFSLDVDFGPGYGMSH
ncbi:MAG: hypothetical protein HOQ05_12165 [Corynebacteriales bacterium]|nr:hypothetical protein [Mycobacteriales bacterium]